MMPLALLMACLQAPTLDAGAGFQGGVFPDAWTRISATVTYDGEPLDAELRVTLRAYSSEPVIYRRPLGVLRKARMRLGVDVFLTGGEYAVAVEVVAAGHSAEHRRSVVGVRVRRHGQVLLVAGDEIPDDQIRGPEGVDQHAADWEQ